MSATDPAAETRSYGRSAGLLAGAVGIAGVLTYIYFSLASHALDRTDYGEIVVLWSASFLLASTMFRPVEQLLARSLADHDQPAGERRRLLRLAGGLQAGLCLALLLALVAARAPIEDELLGGEAFLYWSLIVALAGFAISFFARGFLAGRSQFRFYAWLVMGEVVLRLAFLLPVVVGIATGADLVAVGIATVGLASLGVLPLAVRKVPLGREETRFETLEPETAPTLPEDRPSLSLGSGGAFTGAVLVMMLCEQVLITSGALIVRVDAGAAAAGFIFNVLLVARAPLVLFQAVVASLLPHLSRLRSRGDHGSGEAFRDSVNRTLLLVAAFATATTIGVVAIGPPVMELAFGGELTYDRLGLAIVAAGMGFYLSALALNQAALARGQANVAALGWGVAALAFLAINLLGDLDPFRSVEIGFATGAALLAAWLYRLYAAEVPPPPESGASQIATTSST